MTETEKDAANQKKSQLIIDQNFRCYACSNEFNGNNMPEAAHILIKDKPNLKNFGKLVIHHKSNLRATCKNCNSSVTISFKSEPIKAMGKVIDILSLLLLEDPSIFDYPQMLHAFDSVVIDRITDTIVLAQYSILENFFNHYRRTNEL